MTSTPHSDPQIAQALETAWRHLIAAQGDHEWSDDAWEKDISSHFQNVTEGGFFNVGYTKDQSWYGGLERGVQSSLHDARREWHRAAQMMSADERAQRDVEWVAQPEFLVPEAKVDGLEDAFEREVGYLTAVHARLGGVIDRADDDDILYTFQVQDRIKKQKIAMIYGVMAVGMILALMVATCGS